MRVTLASGWADAIHSDAKGADRLGLLCLAAFLEKHEVAVRIIDAGFENLSRRQLCEAIVASRPDVVGVSCFTLTRFDGLDHGLARLSLQLLVLCGDADMGPPNPVSQRRERRG